MPKREARMVPLGYGKFVRADRVFAVVPLEAGERGEGRRTYVHVDGLAQPIVASRSERAILTDVEAALTEAAGIPRRQAERRPGGTVLVGQLPVTAARAATAAVARMVRRSTRILRPLGARRRA